ncbi:hypothetical protein C4573_03665 [Candidatus Woesearchaeota archaeon]|nr:MAG: hypothetical protein C4573_03665 [Candidatus Woesearchaeota archaeon]
MNESDFEELLKVQNKMASLVSREAEVDSKIKILSLMDDLTTGKKKKIQVEHLIVEAKNQGMSEAEVLSTVDKLKDDGLLAEPESGFIEKS